MSIFRTRAARTALLGGSLLAAVAACADAPTGAPSPAAAPARNVVHASPITVHTLARKVPLAKAYSASITLNKTGGVLSIPEAGLHVNVPRTALPMSDKPITITVTALPGKQVAYEFEPSGTQFKAALRVTQDLSGTTWAGNTGNTQLTSEYFKSAADLFANSGTARSYESLPVTVNATGGRLHWDVRHFSGWLVSTGRADDHDAGF